jgi:polysaccharide deacetylase 2 family uncharacterized protein YibQ
VIRSSGESHALPTSGAMKLTPSSRWFGQLLLLFAVVLAFATSACHWFRSQPLSESERGELTARFKDVIAGAGSSQVWIKRPASSRHGQRPDTSLHVLAASSAYRGVLAALENESARQELDLGEVKGDGRGGLQTIDLNVTRGGQRICRIRLREVPRLLRAAIVIDDLGQDLEAARKLLTLPYPLTFSVLPHLRCSQATAEEIHRAGREVMLHLPMEAEPGAHPLPGEGTICTGMSNAEVQRVVQNDLASVPFAVGVNNHMGSLATRNWVLMAEVMKVLAEHQLYFIDSRTTPDTVALAAAQRQGLRACYRAVFLDDTETVSYTLGQLREFRRFVEERGVGVAIGHPHTTTVEALARFLPELEQADIEVVQASELVRLPEIARLHPPEKPGY